jgi:hypothetical protein
MDRSSPSSWRCDSPAPPRLRAGGPPGDGLGPRSRDGFAAGPRGRPGAGSRRLLLGAVVAVGVVGVVGAVGACRMEERPDEVPPAVEAPAPLPPAAAPGADPEDRGPEEAPPVLGVGEPFWVGDGTRAAELRAVFPSARAVDAYLDRGEPAVRTEDGRVWALGDILVSVEYPEAGPRAIWRVAGPEEVIGRYLERIREAAGAGEHAPLRELGILPLEVRHCCAVEPSRAVPPEE